MRILRVGAGFAVEIQNRVPVEHDVLDAAVIEAAPDHRADAHLFGDRFLVLQAGALLFDDGQRLFAGGGEHVPELNHIALAGGERAFRAGNHAERNVDQVLRPGIAHELDHLEPLPKMQILLVGHHVQALGEIVGVLAVERGGDIPRGVERRPVRTQDDARRHLVLAQIDNLRALIELEQTLFAQFVHHAAHLVVIKALARIAVERYAEDIVNFRHFLERNGFEPVEQLERFRVAVLNLFKPCARLVVQRRLGFRFLMIAHVELDQLVHTAVLHERTVAPALVGNDHLAKLRAPVAQVVDAHGVKTEVVVNSVEGRADHGRRQMADMERLCDVDRRVVDADVPAAADVRAAVAFAFGKHTLQHGLRLCRFIERKIQVSAFRARAFNARRQRQRARKFRGDDRRRFFERLCQPKAGKRIVAHLRRGRRFQPVDQFFGGQRAGCGQRRSDRCFEIHLTHPIPIR
ncbi:hypothetical protein SDC9_80504 [bioreactor metagenome]|uniref:Uncharacterized protein n=1 Tax=bioreactor metagenome TaxID=1076179 RepID=A0A644Z5B7_9ZZZZ